MIGTLLRIGFINLRRDRVVQALTFLLPIMFFSIFAVAFGDQRNPTRKVNVAVVDEDRSEFSAALARALGAEGALQVRTTAKADGVGEPLDRKAAEGLVRAGTVPVAVVLPRGLGANHSFFSDGADRPKIQVLADVSDPIAPQMVLGLLQKVSFTAAPGLVAQAGAAGAGIAGLATETINVMQPGGGSSATVSFYAAGIGVMFLLFSCSGAAGTFLEEEESGTLGRLISSRAGMSGVLLGKWLFVLLVGGLQLTVMFAWGAVMFHLPLLSHLPGFIVMTVATTAAASAFGLVLATLSRSRQQLSGISTIVILAMSALGGSMFPRFLMSETVQKIGLVTFNAWALDGYLKVFWREAPVIDLWPEVSVLTGLTVAFLLVARRFARRWETL